MPSLTSRRHLQTRTDIADAAVALFIDHGYVETTMEAVAEAAGVSRRTAYRHFPNKEDLVFEQPRRWINHFDETLASASADDSLRVRVRRGLLAVAELIQSTASSVLPALSVYAVTPALRGRNGRIQDEWFEHYLELLTPKRRPSPSRSLQIGTVAGAYVGVTTMLLPAWAAGRPDADMVAMTRAALDQLDPIWPEWLDR
jgi:AcrR family transcriptional regulator